MYSSASRMSNLGFLLKPDHEGRPARRCERRTRRSRTSRGNEREIGGNRAIPTRSPRHVAVPRMLFNERMTGAELVYRPLSARALPPSRHHPPPDSAGVRFVADQLVAQKPLLAHRAADEGDGVEGRGDQRPPRA